MREQLQRQEELLRKEQKRVLELQSQAEANQQDLARERKLHKEDRELLREEKRRVQSQLESKQQDLARLRELLSGFQGQEERLREQNQRVFELQNLLDRSHEELGRFRELENEFQIQGERLREYQQRVHELENQILPQELTTRRDQLNSAARLYGRHKGTEQRRTSELQTCFVDGIIDRSEISLEETELGRGAYGVVFRGKYLGCDVAVKKMHQAIMSVHNRSLFEREIAIALKCRHPCLLQFIGATAFTSDDESPMLVTEIMDCSLRTRLYAEPPLSATEICAISLDVARALNYLHKKREPMIHNDISSANVLLRRQGDRWRAKVADYGSINFLHQSTINDVGAGIYCAPEYLDKKSNRPTSKVSDIHFKNVTFLRDLG